MRSRPLFLLAAAGVCWTIGQAVLPDMAMETAARYDLVAASRGAEALSASLLVSAGCLLVLSAVSLAKVVTGRLLTVGTALLGLGGIWLAAGRGAFNMVFVRATHPDVPRDAGIALIDTPGGVEFLPLLLTLPCLLIGPVLLAVGLHRAGGASWLPLVLWVAGVATFMASEFTLKAGEVAGIAVASVALSLIGRSAPVAQSSRTTSSGPPAYRPPSTSSTSPPA
jgi:hypothetical protein